MPFAVDKFRLAGLKHLDVEPFLHQTFHFIHEAGLSLVLRLIEVDLGRPLPPNSRFERKQPFSMIFELESGDRNIISARMALTSPLELDEPLFINQIHCPLDGDPDRAYFEVCMN